MDEAILVVHNCVDNCQPTLSTTCLSCLGMRDDVMLESYGVCYHACRLRSSKC